MYTISFERQPTMKVNIHNQCSDFILTKQGNFSHGTNWNSYCNWRVDAGSMMSAALTPLLATSEVALAYKLERKLVRPVNQSESTHILFSVAWKSEGYKKGRVFVHLIEYDEWFDWSRIKLEEYYQKYANQLCTYTDPIRNTWLTHDGTVLMTELELDFTQRDGVLNVTISEGTRDDHTKIPARFNLGR
jgi:hypothetical protein